MKDSPVRLRMIGWKGALPVLGALLLSTCMAAGCQHQRSSHYRYDTRDTDFGRLLRDYERLPGHRAISRAGDVTTPRWVVGIVSGAPSAEFAREVSLRRCREERQRRHMRDTCKVFAIDDVRMDWLGQPPKSESAIREEPAS